jgi:hypothetical protein
MSRISPDVVELFNKGSTVVEVVSSTGLYVLCYNDQFVNLRERSFLNSSRPNYMTYLRTVFHNPAHANRLAQKLNKSLNTDKFTVKKINQNEQ